VEGAQSSDGVISVAKQQFITLSNRELDRGSTVSGPMVGVANPSYQMLCLLRVDHKRCLTAGGEFQLVAVGEATVEDQLTTLEFTFPSAAKRSSAIGFTGIPRNLLHEGGSALIAGVKS